MRGYGRSSTYTRHEDFSQELIVEDMLELLASLGRDKAVWIGHDWGSSVVWNVASHHPDKTVGVASLCVPYIAAGNSVENRLALVDRSVYPADLYPVGQWDYHYFYEENFDKAQQRLRGQHPQRREGDVPQGQSGRCRQALRDRVGAQERRLVRRRRLSRRAARSRRHHRAGSRSLYCGADAPRLLRAERLVHEPQGERPVFEAGQVAEAFDAGAVPARRLRHDLRDRELALRRADARRLQRSHRSGGEVGPLDGAGAAGRRERGPGADGWRRSCPIIGVRHDISGH